MSELLNHTGKTETSYIVAYIQNEKPELYIRLHGFSAGIAIPHYKITASHIIAELTAAYTQTLRQYCTSPQEKFDIYFKMKNKTFIFEVPVSVIRTGISKNLIDLPVPQFFIKTKYDSPVVGNGITFRIGNFHGYAQLAESYPQEILSPEAFSDVLRSQSRDWILRTKSTVHTSSVYSATGEILAVQPKIVAAAFVADMLKTSEEDAGILFPQKNDVGTATVKLDSRICPAESCCLKSITDSDRFVALFSLSFFYPEDTRFYFEHFFHSPCPDSMITANLTI